MKKYLIIIAFFTLPSFAACPIESGETVCSLPSFREQIKPTYQSNSPSNANSEPNSPLQPLSRQDPINQMRSPNNNLNYNSGCQFGVCLQNPNESRLPINSDID